MPKKGAPFSIGAPFAYEQPLLSASLRVQVVYLPSSLSSFYPNKLLPEKRIAL
ncbi:MAG: hypothetical protein LBU32_07880 [Clostridiales bacterium]|nr:hypothetical protein [Clostridiales bacterium]